jgi:hypothetical protein
MDGTLFVRDTTAKTTGQVGPTATATTVVINAVMSADGASVAYLSNANGGTNGIFSVFQSARVNGKPVVVSVPPTGTLTDGVSSSLAMTPDGHYVVFDSAPDPTTLVNHLYRRDLTKKTTVEVGLSSTGAAPDGLVGGSLLGDDGVAISADGNVIAFDSDATNLIAGDTNDITDIYVRNVSAATTVRASVGTGDVQATSDLCSGPERRWPLRALHQPGHQPGAQRSALRRVHPRPDHRYHHHGQRGFRWRHHRQRSGPGGPDVIRWPLCGLLVPGHQPGHLTRCRGRVLRDVRERPGRLSSGVHIGGT